LDPSLVRLSLLDLNSDSLHVWFEFENRLIFARVMDRRTEVPFLTHSVLCMYARKKEEATAITAKLYNDWQPYRKRSLIAYPEL